METMNFKTQKHLRANVYENVFNPNFNCVILLVMIKWRVIFYSFLLLLLSLNGKAQFKSAVIGVDGLTCSACSFATEKSLKKLESVDSVYMQLEENTATVFFKPAVKVNMDDVAKKVVDAGFSVRSFTALVDVGKLNITPDYCWSYENDIYHFVKVDAASDVNGQINLRFIGDKFMAPKQYKKWKMYSRSTCSSAISQSPYSHNYYVTIQ